MSQIALGGKDELGCEGWWKQTQVEDAAISG